MTCVQIPTQWGLRATFSLSLSLSNLPHRVIVRLKIGWRGKENCVCDLKLLDGYELKAHEEPLDCSQASITCKALAM